MKFKAFLITGIILCIIIVSGCISDPDNFKTKHFENADISFDYPENWEVTVTPDPADIPFATWMINIEDNVMMDDENANINIRIFKFGNETPDLNTNSSTENQINSITIDGITARGTSSDKYCKIYTFFKNNTRYEVLLYTIGPDNTFEEYQSQFDAILNSIHIK